MAQDPANAELAAALEELGDLYELDGADSYRVAAYRRAAQTVRNWPTSVAAAVREGRATELPGIGATLARKLAALLAEGEIPQARELKERYPAGLREVMGLPGIGARRARQLFEGLGIDSREALARAATEGRIRTLKGFGGRFERTLLAALEQPPREREQRFLLPAAEELAQALQEELCLSFVVVGEARRGVEEVAALEVLFAAEEEQRLRERLPRWGRLARVAVEGRPPFQAVAQSGLPVRFHLAPQESFGSALVQLTGSADHLADLGRLAGELVQTPLGLGCRKGGTVRTFRREEDLYRHLGLPLIPPELREGRGEVEAAAAGVLPTLVAQADLVGDLHCHTVASDGRATVEELVVAAKERGYRYLAVTDHSASHGFGRAVSAAELVAQIERIDALNRELEGLRVLAGSEVNILPDGSLDYPDALLARLDWVVASVHTAFSQEESQMTARILRALRHPYVDVLAHPTGRLLGQRPPYQLRLEPLVRAAAESGTFLEINGNPLRRDLDEHQARAACTQGVTLVIDSDAHATDQLALIRYGVLTARRGWVEKGQVANALPWEELSRRRKRARR